MSAEGHAGAPKDAGYDMACCGVSALMFALVAALDRYEIEAEVCCGDGMLRILAKEEWGEEAGIAQIVLDTIAAGLELVAGKYPEYVSFEVR